MIKVVLIDIDNTLLDFNKCAEESVRLSFKKFGLEFNDKTFPVFKSINDGLWLDIEKKKITRQDLHDIRFNLILEALGQKFDGRLIEKEFLDNLYDIAIPCDGAIDVLKYLSK